MLRGLSVWEPSATVLSLLRRGPNPERVAEKPFETRGRWAAVIELGELVIHAAGSRKDLHLVEEAEHGRVLREHGMGMADLRFGYALALVDVVAVWRTRAGHMDRLRPDPANGYPLPGGRAGALGNFNPGRILLQLANVRRLAEPVRMPGRHRVFRLTPAEERAVRAQI
jgi:hypothetical protein